jgi:hypothetical protein
LEYDAQFGTLVRSKGTFPLDGMPLVLGIASMLKQFHPSTTKLLISYLGQFVKSSIQSALQESDTNSGKTSEFSNEIVNTIVFLDMLCQYAGLPRSIVYAFIPPYIFDSVKISK